MRRSVYSRATKGSPKLQEQLVKSIKAMIEKNPSFGYRSLGFRHRIQALPSVALEQGLVHLYGCLGG